MVLFLGACLSAPLILSWSFLLDKIARLLSMSRQRSPESEWQPRRIWNFLQIFERKEHTNFTYSHPNTPTPQHPTHIETHSQTAHNCTYIYFYKSWNQNAPMKRNTHEYNLTEYLYRNQPHVISLLSTLRMPLCEQNIHIKFTTPL